MNNLLSKTEYERCVAETRDERMKWWRDARFGRFIPVSYTHLPELFSLQLQKAGLLWRTNLCHIG